MTQDNKKEITGYSLFEIMHESELAQFVPTPKEDEEMTEKRCERCEFYLMIDSEYGYCKRFPPIEKKKGWKKTEITYPVTEWCRKGCGEMSDKLNNL